MFDPIEKKKLKGFIYTYRKVNENKNIYRFQYIQHIHVFYVNKFKLIFPQNFSLIYYGKERNFSVFFEENTWKREY